MPADSAKNGTRREAPGGAGWSHRRRAFGPAAGCRTIFVVPAPVPGFPSRFPVRDDGCRPWRYRVSAAITRLLVRVLFRGRIRFEGGAGVPREGPLLVVANHISNWDGPILGAFFPGTLFAIAKREMFSLAPVAWWLAGCNVFPVERDAADRRAIRISLDLLRQRQRLLLFIEGHRSRGHGMGPAEAGAGLLVRRTGTPVLPVAIWGTERALHRAGGLLPRRGRIRVRYGRPVSVAGRTHREIADAVAVEVAQLLPARYRGVNAGAALVGTASRAAPLPAGAPPGGPAEVPLGSVLAASLGCPPSPHSPGR